ncbi:unnamed protein product, partial [Iphiclides podalirius]
MNSNTSVVLPGHQAGRMATVNCTTTPWSTNNYRLRHIVRVRESLGLIEVLLRPLDVCGALNGRSAISPSSRVDATNRRCQRTYQQRARPPGRHNLGAPESRRRRVRPRFTAGPIAARRIVKNNGGRIGFIGPVRTGGLHGVTPSGNSIASQKYP